MLLTSVSTLAKRNDERPSCLAISFTMRVYSGESVEAYFARFLLWSPSKFLMMRRVMSSMSLFDDVKPRNGHPYTRGGHDIRTCTSFAQIGRASCRERV